MMKRVFTILCTVMLALSLCIPAFADTTGSITINESASGTTYTVYQMASLESYDKESGFYSYKPIEAWEAFFTGKSDYFQIDEDGGYLSLKSGVTLEAADKAQLAKDALAYAADNTISGTSLTVTEGETAVTFSGLSLGYYLVDSSLGAFCNLTTTDPDASIKEKNEQPSATKKVEEDSNGAWGASNDADLYQTVNFKTTITAQEGAQKYVLHDTMSAGLDLDTTSIKVYRTSVSDANLIEAESNYTLTCATADAPLTDGCDFEIKFTETFCNDLQKDNLIIVTYSAKLNENAVIAGSGNDNSTHLTYGDGSKTEVSTTTTYVYEFDLVKTNASNTLLNGAKFKLYDAVTGGNEIKLVKVTDYSYRVARPDEAAVDKIIVQDGLVTITGLDRGTYYLEETDAPAGYNMLSARQGFTITDTNLKATVNGTAYSEGGVQIVNKTGSLLPDTGGFGTAMLILIGSILVVGTGILLVTKKRMSKYVD